MGSDPAVAAFASAVEALDAEFVCSGAWRGRAPLTLRLPSGEKVTLAKTGGQDRFVRFLAERSEAAPFGDDKQTRTDRHVRHAMRVIGRDGIAVEGFDPGRAGILDIVARELSPYESLDASLTDVVLYPVGGHFAMHKDTPRSERMLGTLVVGLPVAHEGGALQLQHGGLEVELDWGSARSPTRCAKRCADSSFWRANRPRKMARTSKRSPWSVTARSTSPTKRT